MVPVWDKRKCSTGSLRHLLPDLDENQPASLDDSTADRDEDNT